MLEAGARRVVFWTLDALRGGHIHRHVQDIQGVMEGGRPAFKELPGLLQHAIATVPFYRDIPSPAISAFPVVTKETYQNHPEAFRSSSFAAQELHRVSTSGSTGVPLVVFQDHDKRNRNSADLIYFHRNRGWQFGDRFVFLRAWTRLHRKSKLAHIKQNSIPVDVIHFGDAEKERLRTLLKSDRKIRAIVGYASALEGFVNYLAGRGDGPGMFHLDVIISDSDALTPGTKAALERMFGCPVIDRYSNEEQGLIACTRPSESAYQINRASYFLELLKLDRDEPASPGETGRVVVTDLYNRAMPLIRYDVGDLAVSDDPDRTDLRFLKSLQGRVADLLVDTSGRAVSAVILSAALDDLKDIRRYQCIQTGMDRFILKLVTNPCFDRENVLIERMHECLGPDACIRLEYVSEIPNNSNGKFRTTRSELLRQQPAPDPEEAMASAASPAVVQD